MGSTRAALLLVLTGCSGAEICTEEELEAALAGGEQAELGSCTIAGDFVIDQRFMLFGQGPSSEIRGSLTVMTDSEVEVRDLALVSPSGAAIQAENAVLLIRDVSITTELGVGIALENTEVEIDRVTIDGSVDVASPPSLPLNFGIDDTSTHGIVAFGGSTRIADLEISGAAAAGALFSGGTVQWTAGRVFDGLAIGVLVEGGSLTMIGVEVDGIVQGFELPPAYGAVFVGSGDYLTTDVHVTGTQGIGLAQIGGTGVHADLEADANSVAGVWVERGDVELSGSLHDNLFAGFVGVETGTLDIHDASIDRTVKRLRQVELLGSIEVGDGIQVVSPMTETIIRGVTMDGNERAGLLLDLPAQHGTISLMSLAITVSSTAAAAAVAQGSPPPNWDQDVTRNGTDAAADQAKGMFDVLQVIAPCDRPKGTGLVNLSDIGL